MKLIKIEDYKTSQIILLIVIIILVLPPLLSLPAFCKIFDFSNKGGIGDTISGITAPFINGLAAILVFIAFKAQIKANEIFKNQEKSRTIFNQISLIQEDKLEVEKLLIYLKPRVNILEEYSRIETLNIINKIIFFTTEIQLAIELIDEYKGEKKFLYSKLYFLYKIRYKDIFMELSQAIQNVQKIHSDYDIYVHDLIEAIDDIDSALDKRDRYRENIMPSALESDKI
jgi:hypothetical protein